MTEILTRLVVNCETGEQSVVPLTSEEIAQLKIDAAERAKWEAEEKSKAQAKAEAKASALAKLQELGLTEEEAKAIAG